jgi:hypothetical protein
MSKTYKNKKQMSKTYKKKSQNISVSKLSFKKTHIKNKKSKKQRGGALEEFSFVFYDRAKKPSMIPISIEFLVEDKPESSARNFLKSIETSLTSYQTNEKNKEFLKIRFYSNIKSAFESLCLKNVNVMGTPNIPLGLQNNISMKIILGALDVIINGEVPTDERERTLDSFISYCNFNN